MAIAPMPTSGAVTANDIAVPALFSESLSDWMDC
jgi:hypothetical protein